MRIDKEDIMRVLLVCAGGFSTGLLMKKMKNYWEEQGIDLVIEATSVRVCDEVSDNYEVVLIGPQVGYQLDNIKERTGLPCAIIPSMDYGIGNCPNIMKLVKEMYEEI